jgi:hypothetical protein
MTGPVLRCGRAGWLLVVCVVGIGQAVRPTPADAQEGIDVTARVSVDVGTPTFDSGKGLWRATVRIDNTSPDALFAPMSAVVRGLTTGIVLDNASWVATDGSPLLDVGLRKDTLKPGTGVTLDLAFRASQDADVTFTVSLYALLAPRAGGPPTKVSARIAPASTTDGTRIDAVWHVGGGDPSRERALQVRVRAPGPLTSPEGAEWINPGVPPPTGPTSYLTPHGVWQAAPISYLRTARDDSASFLLPDQTTGSWLVEIVLVEASGEVITSAGAPVIVSTTPAISLRLNRPIANSLDRVAAMVVMAAGVEPRPVRLMAWLVRPDGTVLGLPELFADDLEVYRGPSANTTFRLLDRFFDADATGAYQVHARLFDATSGEPLARASGGFEVCDATSTLHGMVWSEQGGPLGANARTASVRAIAVDDRASTATNINASGAYTMTLAPGRYLLQALVIDASSIHRAQSEELLQVGCTATDLTRDLTTSVATAVFTSSTESSR